MDKYGFNNGNKNNPDFYFSNSEVTPPVNHKNNTTTNTKAKMKKKPSSGVGSTYLFHNCYCRIGCYIDLCNFLYE